MNNKQFDCHARTYGTFQACIHIAAAMHGIVVFEELGGASGILIGAANVLYIYPSIDMRVYINRGYITLMCSQNAATELMFTLLLVRQMRERRRHIHTGQKDTSHMLSHLNTNKMKTTLHNGTTRDRVKTFVFAKRNREKTSQRIETKRYETKTNKKCCANQKSIQWILLNTYITDRHTYMQQNACLYFVFVTFATVQFGSFDGILSNDVA